MEQIPVLVVGGGPVGLSMAIALRHVGIACMVVERHATTLDFPKGRGTSIRTMEIFRQWGIEDQVVRAGLAREDSLYFFVGETLLGERYERSGFTMTSSDALSPTDRLVCSQEVLEPLLAIAAACAGADVRFSTRLETFQQDADGVTADIVNQRSTRHTVRCAWLVAADGARSQVRAALGIGLQGPGALGDAVSILIEADLKERIAGRASALYAVLQPRLGALFTAVDNDRRWLLLLPRDPQSEPPDSFTETRCLDLVRAALGDPAVPLRVLGQRLWQPTAHWADTFRQGRVFLVGDAAHVTTPSGGLGMNCGIADVHNLAWKLAGVLQGWASAALLDSYDQERRPIAQATVEASLAVGAQARETTTRFAAQLQRSAPRRGQGAGDQHPLHHPFGRGHGVTLGPVYSSTAIVDDGTPPPAMVDPIFDYVPTGRPGHRAPHLWLERAGHRLSTLDLFGRGFTLLIDAGTSAAAHAGRPLAAAGVAAAGVIPLAVHRIGPAGDFVVAEDHWRHLYGLDPGGCVLVRPDGYGCWRSSGRPAGGWSDIAQALRVATGYARPHDQ